MNRDDEVTLAIVGTVNSGFSGTLQNTAVVTSTEGIPDPDTTNNQSTDTNTATTPSTPTPTPAPTSTPTLTPTPTSDSGGGDGGGEAPPQPVPSPTTVAISVAATPTPELPVLFLPETGIREQANNMSGTLNQGIIVLVLIGGGIILGRKIFANRKDR